MYRAIIAGTLAILAAALLLTGSARAGGATSAASKYGHTSKVAAVQTSRSTRRADFPITEFSSSSVRTPSYGHAYR
jgi:hypothetical protein